MYKELPKITRCCFCIPLRYGLLIWAYIKLLFCLFVAFVLVMRNVKSHENSRLLVSKTEIIIDAVAAVSFLADIIVTLIFIVGAHKKNPKLLRIYYRYTIIVVFLLFFMYLFGIGLDVYGSFFVYSNTAILFDIYEVILLAILSGGSLIFNLYFLILIKNEIVKLENNTQLSFTNHITDPKCYIKSNESELESAAINIDD